MLHRIEIDAILLNIIFDIINKAKILYLLVSKTRHLVICTIENWVHQNYILVFFFQLLITIQYYFFINSRTISIIPLFIANAIDLFPALLSPTMRELRLR